MCRGPMQAQCLWIQSLQAYLNLVNSVVLVPWGPPTPLTTPLLQGPRVELLGIQCGES